MPESEEWRLLPFSDASAGEQLAYTSALLSRPITRPTLRSYVMTPPALILGASQPVGIIDSDRCRQAGIAAYQRTAGGTIVYADEYLLSLDIALPPGHVLASHNLTESYRWLGETLVLALATIGVATRLVSVNEAREAPDSWPEEIFPSPPSAPRNARSPTRLPCYASLSPYEVLAGNRKVAGLAQIRRKAGALFVAGILLRWQPKPLANLLTLPNAARSAAADFLRRLAVGLDSILGQDVAASEVETAFATALAKIFSITFQPSTWTQEEEEERQKLTATRYQSLF